MLRNEYALLKKANDLSADTLSADNRLVLEDICRHLVCLTWNCYEIERIRKDLIDIAARCDLEGRALQEEVGGDTDRFLLELAPDLPRGTPLDYVCIWYPKWLLLLAVLYLPGLLLPGGNDPNLFRVLIGPIHFMLWLLIWAWFQRVALKIKIRYGKWALSAAYTLGITLSGKTISLKCQRLKLRRNLGRRAKPLEKFSALKRIAAVLRAGSARRLALKFKTKLI